MRGWSASPSDLWAPLLTPHLGMMLLHANLAVVWRMMDTGMGSLFFFFRIIYCYCFSKEHGIGDDSWFLLLAVFMLLFTPPRSLSIVFFFVAFAAFLYALYPRDHSTQFTFIFSLHSYPLQFNFFVFLFLNFKLLMHRKPPKRVWPLYHGIFQGTI